MVFQVKGEYGSKWEYKADPTGIGISKYEIDWQGAKFDYNREIRLKSNHLGYNSTTLEIDRKDIAEAIVISVSDITIHIDPTGAVSAVPESLKVDVDDDGEIEDHAGQRQRVSRCRVSAERGGEGRRVLSVLGLIRVRRPGRSGVFLL